MMSVVRFLGMVGALIWSSSKQKYLILKRSSDKDFGSDVWECGTGRVDQNENFTQALRREIREELSIEVNIDFIIGTTHFYRGEAVPENEMIGVFYFCTLDDPGEIKVSWEHSTYKWVSANEAELFLPKGYWLVRLINRAEFIRSQMPNELIDYQRTMGFEI
jgi:8-oxo-dGTP diphosphatase